MNYEGVLTKMRTEYGSPINYYLIFESEFIHMNQLLGKNIKIDFISTQCLGCGLEKKLFRQGYCYDDFYKLPNIGDWIMKPELSTAHLNIEDRDLEYEKKVQLQPHIVYLANSSNVKVGVTRKTQVPTRWIDQGANKAVEVVEVPNRYLAGIAEVALKEHIADKTNWRKMLTSEGTLDQNLTAIKNELKQYLPEEVLPYYLEDVSETTMNFPINQTPKKVTSINLSKTAFFEGKLVGIKGQYLIFEDQSVFNVRNHEGYKVSLEISR